MNQFVDGSQYTDKNNNIESKIPPVKKFYFRPFGKGNINKKFTKPRLMSPKKLLLNSVSFFVLATWLSKLETGIFSTGKPGETQQS